MSNPEMLQATRTPVYEYFTPSAQKQAARSEAALTDIMAKPVEQKVEISNPRWESLAARHD